MRVPVVDESGNKAIANLTIRDVQYLLTAPEIYKDYRSVFAIVALVVFFLFSVLKLLMFFPVLVGYRSKIFILFCYKIFDLACDQ